MPRRKKDPLRVVTPEEHKAPDQLSRSRIAPAVEVARAKLLLAVARRILVEVEHTPTSLRTSHIFPDEFKIYGRIAWWPTFGVRRVGSAIP